MKGGVNTLSLYLSESRITQRTRKARKGVLDILRYFHNHQALCKLRTEEMANFTRLLMGTLCTRFIDGAEDTPQLT